MEHDLDYMIPTRNFSLTSLANPKCTFYKGNNNLIGLSLEF
jgi:hypothetical protein